MSSRLTNSLTGSERTGQLILVLNRVAAGVVFLLLSCEKFAQETCSLCCCALNNASRCQDANFAGCIGIDRASLSNLSTLHICNPWRCFALARVGTRLHGYFPGRGLRRGGGESGNGVLEVGVGWPRKVRRVRRFVVWRADERFPDENRAGSNWRSPK